MYNRPNIKSAHTDVQLEEKIKCVCDDNWTPNIVCYEIVHLFKTP